MSNLINDLAIVLTKKIEGDLVRVFMDGKKSPSFYNIRETLIDTLSENMDILSFSTSESPEMLREMPPSQVEAF